MGEDESDLQKEYRERNKKENLQYGILYLLVFIGVPGFGTWKWHWTEFDAFLSFKRSLIRLIFI